MSGYAPVSTTVLAGRVWGVPAHKTCDLPPGSYPYAKARDHGCLTEGTPIPGVL